MGHLGTLGEIGVIERNEEENEIVKRPTGRSSSRGSG
jgi:hypothetical protein